MNWGKKGSLLAEVAFFEVALDTVTVPVVWAAVTQQVDLQVKVRSTGKKQLV